MVVRVPQSTVWPKVHIREVILWMVWREFGEKQHQDPAKKLLVNTHKTRS